MERKCKFLLTSHEGIRVDCFIDKEKICECPKKRGKLIITPMCWRIKQ